MPLVSESPPPPMIRDEWASLDAVARPEWFGDGLKSFREILVKRPLGETVVAASPKDFVLR